MGALSRAAAMNPSLSRRPLLKALEDPERFAAAHIVLDSMYAYHWSLGRPERYSLVQWRNEVAWNDDGLLVRV
jgi:hypothetical protein